MTCQVGAHFEALDEGVLLVPLDHKYTQVGFNLVSDQVCTVVANGLGFQVRLAKFDPREI